MTPSHSHHQDDDGLRVLVCGSSRFNDPEFVFGLLNGFHSHFKIATILSGPFSGADEFTRQWAQENGIRYEPVLISEDNALNLQFFDEHRELPPLVIRNDPVFKKGYERLRDSAPHVILTIPTPDGVLGPTSACLKRMASAIDIECIDGAEAMQAISGCMIEQAHQMSQEEAFDTARVAVSRSGVRY